MGERPSPLGPQQGFADQQTITAKGNAIGPTIEGVVVRDLTSVPDERGELVELISSDWDDIGGDRIVHSYLSTLEPGIIKGWISHALQDDRVVTVSGRIRWVLYDGREGSPTLGSVQLVTATERRRRMVMIPPGVWHAAENVGSGEAVFINFPSEKYNYEAPDKARLPLDTPLIPFSFTNR